MKSIFDTPHRKWFKLNEPKLDWRNPSMPVIRTYKMADGTTRTEVDPDYERRYREHMMNSAEQPKFRDDPTYEMRRTKK